MSSPRIEVEIGELVLHGFDPGHGDAIAAAVAAELTIALDGWRAAGARSAAHVDAGSFELSLSATPPAIGRSAARRIRAGID